MILSGVATLAIAVAARDAGGAASPLPGSASSLTDWRWMSRPPRGQRHTVGHLPGQAELDSCDGGFALLDVRGPGVLDHVLLADGAATMTLWVDDQKLWIGALDPAISAAEAATADTAGPDAPLFPAPLVFSGGPLRHLIAPVGFAQSLRIVVDKPRLGYFLSYRTFPAQTPVLAASPDPRGRYANELRTAAEILRGGVSFPDVVYRDVPRRRHAFVLQAGERLTVLDAPGSGELVQLEIHINPALNGTLRNVVVELRYDGADEPAIRLPLPELVGLPHPWITHRWHRFNGTLAAGLRYPWAVDKPRFYFPEDTFYFNLPAPFANGLRIDLVNRSDQMRFTGELFARIAPLDAQDGRSCGRLCALRVVRPVAPTADPELLLRVPGAGRLVGLGLFTTGGDRYPPAVHNCHLSLQCDDARPVLGQGVIPLWFMGQYGGSIGNRPLWNHPLYDDRFAGVTRYFLTDPPSFTSQAAFRFTPGVQAAGAPTAATALAFWYRFDSTPFAAPPLPERPETLPYSRFETTPAARDSRLFCELEAAELVVSSAAHGGEARVVEDVDHNYHPSQGRYLHYVADRAGDYLDCVTLFPSSTYFSVGTNSLWGPNRGTFELDVLSRSDATNPPKFPHGDAFYLGRVLGSVPMRAPVFVGHDLRSLRDTVTEYPLPFRNPAPDQPGVLRFICQTKPQDSSAYLLKLAQVRIDLPPIATDGTFEFEDLAPPVVRDGLVARLPKQGRFEWSGWGAVRLRSPPGGKAVFTALAPIGRATVVKLGLRGSLSPEQGRWQVRLGSPEAPSNVTPSPPTAPPTDLRPGADAQAVVEWTVPAEGLRLPGLVQLEFECTAAPGESSASGANTTDAELTLDSWLWK